MPPAGLEPPGRGSEGVAGLFSCESGTNRLTYIVLAGSFPAKFEGSKIMGQPVVHFEILGKDAKNLQDFYSDLFGWHINNNNLINYGEVDTGSESGIGGGIGLAQGENHVTFYIQVDDPQAHLDKIEAKGGRTVVPVTEIPDMVTFALFADPEGNVVGLVKE